MHFPAIHPKRDSIRCGRILSAVAVLMTASCGCCGRDCPKSIDVIPDMVTAVPDKQFLMSVRLTTENGHVLPDASADAVQWSSDDSRLTLTPPKGAQTQAKLALTAVGPITITASLDDLSAQATITRAQPGASFKMDWATSDHVDGERPTLVLLDGWTNSEWRSDTLVAFVGAGALDEFKPSEEAGEVTVFSPGHALQRKKVSWNVYCDHVRMTEGGVPYATEVTTPDCTPAPMSLDKPTSIPIHIWALIGSGTPVGAIDIHLAEARRQLANGWTGLTLDLESPGIEVLDARPIILDLSEATGWTCPLDGEFSLVRQLKEAGVAFGPGKVTVVYAHALMEPSAEGLVPSSLPGYTCQRDAALGTVVLVSWTTWRGTTFAHELGHAIGPPLVHTDGMVGLNDSNLMWSAEIAVPASRSLLTLGQAFRLGLDADRFQQGPASPTDPRCTDQNEGAEIPCPRMSKDVVRR